MMFCHIVKQLISCFLLSMLLSQSVVAGIVLPMVLDNNSLTKVEHHVNNHSIEHQCTNDNHLILIKKH
jgi:hypothetical protein